MGLNRGNLHEPGNGDLSRRYDVEILMAISDLQPDIRLKLVDELKRLDEEVYKIIEKDSTDILP